MHLFLLFSINNIILYTYILYPQSTNPKYISLLRNYIILYIIHDVLNVLLLLMLHISIILIIILDDDDDDDVHDGV